MRRATGRLSDVAAALPLDFYFSVFLARVQQAYAEAFFMQHLSAPRFNYHKQQKQQEEQQIQLATKQRHLKRKTHDFCAIKMLIAFASFCPSCLQSYATR